MGEITSEELGNGVKLGMEIAGIVGAIILAGVGFLKFFVTRYEYNKFVAELREDLRELKENQGKMNPVAESQMLKILQKLDDTFSAKQRRK